jgi:DNA-binding CsgD family transcriptional regulator/PAS domain-containing protein
MDGMAGELEREERLGGLLDADDLQLVERHRLVAGLPQQIEEEVGLVEHVHGPLLRRARPDPCAPGRLCRNAPGLPATHDGRITKVSGAATPGRQELLATAERLADIGAWALDLPSLEARWSDGLYRIHGLAPQSEEPSIELLLEYVHPEDRERIKALLSSVVRDPSTIPPDGLHFDYRIVRRDGSVRELSAIGRVERDEASGTARWFGVEQDVTEQRLTERDLRLHYAVSQALREWESFDEGVVVLLRRMATALEFPAAALWTHDPKAEQLVCRAAWSEPGLASREFDTETRGLTFREGEGLVGRAWMTRQPVISPDVASDPNFRRPESAAKLGISSALLFPAIGYDGPIAVLAFYSFDRHDMNERLVRTMTGIGNELGRFLSRRRAQLQPSPLSARELEVLELGAEGNSGPQIAEKLVVSPSTIKTHFENIYEKLGVSDRAAAVAVALRTGLIS